MSSKRMLIDASHPEETRVVVLSGNRLEEFDHETTARKQLKGNIYLAKVTRVEPSLQAAFVEYGGNRHGFLPFSEIHPDYYRIPIADREVLLAEAAARQSEDDDAEDGEPEARKPRGRKPRGRKPQARGRQARKPRDLAPDDESGAADSADSEPAGQVADNTLDPTIAPEALAEGTAEQSAGETTDQEAEAAAPESGDSPEGPAETPAGDQDDGPGDAPTRAMPLAATQETITEDTDALDDPFAETPVPSAEDQAEPDEERPDPDEVETEPRVETVGGDEVEEDARKRRAVQQRYKIQEVIKRRQVILVQVAKEERGTKGAALTTYLSLAGRYCVLMPNTARGGGISRKISSATDRRRLKKVTSELEIPEGMAVIVRTAGSERSKVEIRRDYDYMLRLWDQIRSSTLESTAPALIHEEANLIKRAIRDLYDRDMDKIEVQGEESYKDAKAFMKSLMPSHARKVQLYKDLSVPLFFRNQVEEQLDAMHQTTVRLRSGGYIVINSTEALVAIDVNSGKATKERHIEETALKTNTEAAAEIARQLRLRDLAGLIVIDFIDMEENRHNREVERRLKEAMRLDRARIQLGRISPFGLLELSRQRLRPSLFENSTEPCSLCGGSGHVRSIESSALHLLRALEEEGIRRHCGQVQIKAPAAVALYLLNQKRARLLEVEQRYEFEVLIEQDDSLIAPAFVLDHFGAQNVQSAKDDVVPDKEEDSGAADAGDQDPVRRKRRRRRTRRNDAAAEASQDNGASSGERDEDEEEAAAEAVVSRDAPRDDEDGEAAQPKLRRRRGKRGGRRRTRSSRDEAAAEGGADDALDESGESSQVEARTGDAEPAEAAANENDPRSDDGEAAARDSKPRARRARPRGSRRRSEPAVSQSADETTVAGGEPASVASSLDADVQAQVPPAEAQPCSPAAVSAEESEPDDTSSISVPSFTEEETPVAAQPDGDDGIGAEEPVEQEPDKPKRRGWWNRFV